MPITNDCCGECILANVGIFPACHRCQSDQIEILEYRIEAIYNHILAEKKNYKTNYNLDCALELAKKDEK